MGIVSVKVPQFDDGKLQAFLERYARNVYVRVGIFEGSVNEKNGMNVAEYAAYNEFGTSRIPARPFMRQTVAKRANAWGQYVTKQLGAGADISAAMELTGKAMVSDIQGTIAGSMPPANAPSTVRAKTREVIGGGEMAPGTLIDTGEMLKAVNYEVMD